MPTLLFLLSVLCGFQAFGAPAALPEAASPAGGARGPALILATDGGTLSGLAQEFVYDQDVSRNYEVSGLDWPFVALPYYGIGLDADFRHGLFASASLRSGIMGRYGVMADSDFTNGDGVRTLFSESDCSTEQAFIAGARLGVSHKIGRSFALAPYASLSYRFFQWSSRDGYLQYPASTGHDYYFDSNGGLHYGTNPAWTSDTTKTPIYGTGIIYSQRILTGALGLRGSWAPLDCLTLSAGFEWAPVVSCLAIDNHEYRMIKITDSLKDGYMLRPSLSCSYALSERESIVLSISYDYIAGLVGSSTWEYEEETDTSPNSQYIAGPSSDSAVPKGAGASFQALDVGLSARVSL